MSRLHRTWVLLTLAACAPAARQVDIDCTRHEHCPAEEVCFLSRCVEPGVSSSLLYADIVPPNNSGLLPQYDGEPRDLSLGLKQDLVLRDSVSVSGTITASGDPDPQREGLLQVVEAPVAGNPVLPSSTLVHRALVSTTGFVMPLLPDTAYVMSFEPQQASSRPPVSWSAPVAVVAPPSPVELDYPADASLVRVTGVVLADFNQPLAGVRVEGRGCGGDSTKGSTTAVTDEEGRYTVAFPPGCAPPFTLRVYPEGNARAPTATAELVLVTPPSGSDPGVLEDLVIGFPAGLETLVVHVTDPDGEPIADATVLFAGSHVGIGTYDTSAVTESDGRAELKLLRGLYTLWVAPAVSGAGALWSAHYCVASAETEADACDDGLTPVGSLERVDSDTPIAVPLAPKSRVLIDVEASDGEPAAEARVVLRHRGGPVPREFTGTADSAGELTLDVDPGTLAADTVYDVTVEAQQSPTRPLARHAETFAANDDGIQELHITLLDASLVHGQITTTDGDPAVDVRIGFFSVDLGTREAPLLVGLGQSNEVGEFVIPIPAPDVP